MRLAGKVAIVRGGGGQDSLLGVARAPWTGSKPAQLVPPELLSSSDRSKSALVDDTA